ncbi:MAG TPA: metalloregulator ArsR/SmtB family transcription factor [Candidatus Cryosericum sp.]
MTDTVDAIVIARALGDTTRARIVALLQRRDLCVCELTKVLGQSQANISGHLKLLVSSSIITSNRRSYWTHYALAGNLPTDISHFLSAIMLQTTAQYPGDVLALEHLPRDVCTLKQQERRNAREGKQKPK